MKLLLICVGFFLVQVVFVDARPLPEEGSWFSWFGRSTSESTTEASPVVIPQDGAKRENRLYGLVQSILDNGTKGPNVAVGIGFRGINAIFTIQELGIELMRIIAAKGASLMASVAATAFQTGQQMVVDGASAFYSGVSAVGSGVGSNIFGSQTE